MNYDPITHIVYGGAFDPITPAHAKIITSLAEQYNHLGYQIELLVTDNDEKHYHAGISDRVNMLTGWVNQNCSALSVSGINISIQTKRTADTIRERWPNAHVVLVLGEDERTALVDRKEWVDSDWIINHCEIKTFERNDGISSSKLRKMMCVDPMFAVNCIDGSLAPAVRLYILEHGLYNQLGANSKADEEKFILEYKQKPKQCIMEILEHFKQGIITKDEAFNQITNADFPHPSVTATVIIHNTSNNKYLLIRRKAPPFASYLAFPGGFANPGEDIEDVAIRELCEECGIEIDRAWLNPIKLYKAADPRGWMYDFVFVASIYGNQASKVKAGDDAAEFYWLSGEEIMQINLAFHHKDAFERFYAKKNS